VSGGYDPKEGESRTFTHKLFALGTEVLIVGGIVFAAESAPWRRQGTTTCSLVLDCLGVV